MAPQTAAVTWRRADGETTQEEAIVTVNMRLLFINGIKRGKLSDLMEPPRRSHCRLLDLNFQTGECCGILFESKKQCDDIEKLIVGEVKKRKASALGADPNWEESLRSALALASSRKFTNPLPDAPLLIKDSGKVAAMLRDVCAAWEAADSERERNHEDKTRNLVAQRSADESIRKRLEDELRLVIAQRDDAVRTRQRLQEEMESKLARADRGVAAVQQQLRELREENVELKQKQQDGGQCNEAAWQYQAKARCIAEFECTPLLNVSAEELPVLKKKLLLKWHPDKQPGSVHAALATEVMQEMQNRPEWKL